MLLGDNPPIVVPLSLSSGAYGEDRHTGAVRKGDHETDPTPAAYGAHLAKRINQDIIEINSLTAKKRERPTNDNEIGIRRTSRLLRLKSIYDAVWALHMIEISDDPKVWRLLDQNATELNQPATNIMDTLKKASEATVAGDTRKLEVHIRECIGENLQRGRHPTRPSSELERFMGRVPAGSDVLSRLRMLQRVAMENTEESRLLVEDTMYGLWWVLESKAREFDTVIKEVKRSQ